MRRVYSILGVPPEIQAYAMAKYSRSSQSMLESIEELSQQRAEKFLNTFYFQYGHRSIADLAHLVLALEDISILAAIEVVDEQVWDGQERSTRYQNFRKSGYYTPTSLSGASLELYRETADGLFAGYQDLSAQLLEVLKDSTPRPPNMDEGQYERTLRARAFDVARGLLPMATNTSVGQVVSARVLERQISRLLSVPYAEVQEIGADLRGACLQPAEAPLWQKAAREQGLAVDALGELAGARAAPTLVKYAQPLAYMQETHGDLEQAARELLSDVGQPDRQTAVELARSENIQDELVATLLYRGDTEGRSYRQIQERVCELSEAQKREVADLSLARRGPHDELLREHQSGYALKFDILMDLGAFRDLHRHRRCVQVRQPYVLDHGFDSAEEVFQAGIGDGAWTGGAGAAMERYAAALGEAERRARSLAETHLLEWPYLMPLAGRCRSLFKMDLAQAAYIIELRTGPAGHFSYRRIAWQMYRALQDAYPHFAATVRAADPGHVVDLLTR